MLVLFKLRLSYFVIIGNGYYTFGYQQLGFFAVDSNILHKLSEEGYIPKH